MNPLTSRRLLVVAFCSAAFAWSPVGLTEVTPGSPASTTVPKTTPAPAKPTQSDELQSSTEEGATAKCRDGSYFHGNPSQHPCSNKGGVQKWLKGQGQDLIR
jgi:hypothetical protein